MRVTKKMLDSSAELMNLLTGRAEGERYYVGYENGKANLFREANGGRQTISYGNTKSELFAQMSVANVILVTEEERSTK